MKGKTSSMQKLSSQLSIGGTFSICQGDITLRFRCVSVQVQVLSGAPGKDDPDWAFRMGAWGGSSVFSKNS